MMNSSNEQLHIIFLPYMAPGHMMPMVDMARLFASQGVHVTIITTAMNAQRFKTTIDRDISAGRKISIETVPFPWAEAGLPKGCENVCNTTTPEMTIRLFHAINMLQPEIEKLLRSIRSHCIISDILFHWTVDVAIELGIPRLAFSGSGFFNLSVSNAIEQYQPHKNLDSEDEQFLVPTLPDHVLLTRSQLPDVVKTQTKFTELFQKLKEAEKKSYGTVVNSFHELEGPYGDYYKKAVKIKAWHVGPVSIFNKDENDKAERGSDSRTSSSVDRHRCLDWLDSKSPNSVLYICFGSVTRFSKTQLTEIALALEEGTSCSFVWVVAKVMAKDKKSEDDNEYWLPEGFEERLKKSRKGMVLKGWAPQVLILEHPAIGGFLTHCGWNSILEGVVAGLPLITWPLIADQFYNEKLVTQVHKFGVPVGNEVWNVWATEETPLIKRDKISMAVNKAMNGEEGMRTVAHRLAKSAKKAAEEGGSSDNDIKALINDVKQYKRK